MGISAHQKRHRGHADQVHRRPEHPRRTVEPRDRGQEAARDRARQQDLPRQQALLARAARHDHLRRGRALRLFRRDRRVRLLQGAHGRQALGRTREDRGLYVLRLRLELPSGAHHTRRREGDRHVGLLTVQQHPRAQAARERGEDRQLRVLSGAPPQDARPPRRQDDRGRRLHRDHL